MSHFALGHWMETDPKKLFYVFFIILFLHICLLLFSEHFFQFLNPHKLVFKTHSQERVLRVIVESSDSKFRNLKVSAKFLSDVQRTFENESIRLGSSKALTFKDFQLTPKELGEIKKQSLQNQKNLSIEEFVDNRLEGDQTKLNTIAFKYFSFFQRIKSKLTPVWRQKIQKLAAGRFSTLNLKTVIRIWINQKGELIRYQLADTSGLREVDRIALEAVLQVAPFENPPRGLFIKETFAFDWGFIILINKTD